MKDEEPGTETGPQPRGAVSKISAYCEKEQQLVAELANRALAAISQKRLKCQLLDGGALRFELADGHVMLLRHPVTAGVTCFNVFNAVGRMLGGVTNAHPSLRYDLGDCLHRLLIQHDPELAEHQLKVATFSSMYGELAALMDDKQLDPAVPAVTSATGAASPVAEEDVVDEPHPEDAEYAFRDDMAEQAQELGQAAREDAGVDAEAPLASLPGRPPAEPPAPAPVSPQPKLVVRKVLRMRAPPPAPPTSGKSRRVLDGG